MKTARILFCAGALFCLFGCSKDKKSVSPEEPDVIMPLAVGNQWTGMKADYDSLGNEEFTYSSVIQIDKDTTIGDEQWFMLSIVEMGETYSGLILINRDDGTWGWYGYNQEPPDLPCMFAKFPASVGESFESGASLSDDVTVISTDESITVPAGTFECYHYEWIDKSGAGYDTDVWMAANTGLVRIREQWGGSSGGYTIWELHTIVD